MKGNIIHFVFFIFKKIFFPNNKRIKENNASGEFLTICDVQESLGDYINLSHFLKLIDSQNNNLNVFVSSKYKEFNSLLGYKKINFLYKVNNFGDAWNLIKNPFSIFLKILKMKKEYKNIDKKISKIFICCEKITLEQLILIYCLNPQKIYMLSKHFNFNEIEKYIFNPNDIIIPQVSLYLSRYLLSLFFKRIEFIYHNQFSQKNIANICFDSYNQILKTDSEKKFQFTDFSIYFSKIDIATQENHKLKVKNILFMLNRNMNKTLKLSVLFQILNYINDNFEKINLILVGCNSEEYDYIKEKINVNFKIIEKIGKLPMIELVEICNSVDLIISVESSINHIANFLKKRNILIINSDFQTYNYEPWYWTYANNNNLVITLNKKFFLNGNKNFNITNLDENTLKKLSNYIYEYILGKNKKNIVIYNSFLLEKIDENF